MSEETDKKKDEAKQLLIQARLYRLIGMVMAVAGVLIFATVYFKSVQGHMLEMLTDPGTIGMVLVPFLPATVFMWMAGSSEKKLDAVISEIEAASAAPKAAKPAEGDKKEDKAAKS